jgi:hypothetical protein
MNADGLRYNGFIYNFELVDAQGNVVDAWVEKNLIPQVGLDFLIQAPFGDVSPQSDFYCFVFRNAYIPTSATTAADIPSNLGEFVNYSEATRPLWNRGYDGAGTIDNSASRAQFTFTQDQNIYGAGLVSSSTKGGASGLLLSVVRFASPKTVSAGLTLNLTSGITYIPTNIV